MSFIKCPANVQACSLINAIVLMKLKLNGMMDQSFLSFDLFFPLVFFVVFWGFYLVGLLVCFVVVWLGFFIFSFWFSSVFLG